MIDRFELICTISATSGTHSWPHELQGYWGLHQGITPINNRSLAACWAIIPFILLQQRRVKEWRLFRVFWCFLLPFLFLSLAPRGESERGPRPFFALLTKKSLITHHSSIFFHIFAASPSNYHQLFLTFLHTLAKKHYLCARFVTFRTPWKRSQRLWNRWMNC